MKWFDRWFANKCRWAWEQASTPAPMDYSKYGVISTAAPVKNSRGINSAGLELSIYGADGGTVLEFRQYDMQRDRCEYSLHVIPQDSTFEERLGQAITMEMLKRGLQK